MCGLLNLFLPFYTVHTVYILYLYFQCAGCHILSSLKISIKMNNLNHTDCPAVYVIEFCFDQYKCSVSNNGASAEFFSGADGSA